MASQQSQRGARIAMMAAYLEATGIPPKRALEWAARSYILDPYLQFETDWRLDHLATCNGCEMCRGEWQPEPDCGD